jgi:large subunit ribosomal protein L35
MKVAQKGRPGKIRSRSAAKSRVRKTGTGKIKVMKAARKHLLQQKSGKQKRLGKSGSSIITPKAHAKHIKKALPNGI